MPWVASVYFAEDVTGGHRELYFLSSPHTRHGRNIAANAVVAAAINADEHAWRKIRGVQLEGRCQRIDGVVPALRA